MQILKSIEEVKNWRRLHDAVAFVPTMGNLHAGHISLVTRAKQCSPNVIVSIFVNPLQFGAGEDLDSYPRTLDADIAKLENAGVSALFTNARDALWHGYAFYGDSTCIINIGSLWEGSPRAL